MIKQEATNDGSHIIIKKEHTRDDSQIQIKQEPDAIPNLESLDNAITYNPNNYNPLHCYVCNQTMNSTNDICKHILTHLQPQTCNECNLYYLDSSFKSNCQYKHQFMDTFYKTHSIYCQYCGYISMRDNTYVNHLENRCPYQFNSNNYYPSAKNVKQTNAPNTKKCKAKTYICKDCNRSFKSGSSLGGHRNIHRKKKNITKTVIAKRKIFIAKRKTNTNLPTDNYKCPYCKHDAKNKQRLTNHIRTHTNERPFKCSKCDKRFTVQCDLKSHIQAIHENNREYKCKYCPKAFNRKDRLNAHENIHTGNKPYKCKYCNECFTNPSSKHKHERNQHIGWKCKYCSERFNTEYAINKHRKSTHSNQKKGYIGENWFDFACEKCDMRFQTSEQCDAHYKLCNEEYIDAQNDLDVILKRGKNELKVNVHGRKRNRENITNENMSQPPKKKLRLKLKLNKPKKKLKDLEQQRVINITNNISEIAMENTTVIKTEFIEAHNMLQSSDLLHGKLSQNKEIIFNENSDNMEYIRIIEGRNNVLMILDNEKCNDYSKGNDIDDIILTNHNLNDGIVRILNDNININWCPKCGIKVTRTDEDIKTQCSIMTCREKRCGDGNHYTYWCWDCRSIINMNKLSFDVHTNEPAGACNNCRKKSRIKRNKCKTTNYKE